MSITAIILAGGLGTRLRAVVNDRPKPLALINGTPFIEYLILQLKNPKITEIIISTGYKHEMFQYLLSKFNNLNIKLLPEKEALGTGGAISYAASAASNDELLILNGDSYINEDLNNFLNLDPLEMHMKTVYMDDCSRYGSVISANGFLHAFTEKGSSSNGYINAGIYKIPKCLVPTDIKKYSFEQDFISKNTFRVHNSLSSFIDIGIPEDYEKAQKFFKDIPRP